MKSVAIDSGVEHDLSVGLPWPNLTSLPGFVSLQKQQSRQSGWRNAV